MLHPCTFAELRRAWGAAADAMLFVAVTDAAELARATAADAVAAGVAATSEAATTARTLGAATAATARMSVGLGCEPAVETPFVDMRDGLPLDVVGLQARVMTMMSASGAFESLVRCVTYFVIDTTGLTAPEFCAWYMACGAMGGILKGVQTRSLLLALHDFSLGSGNAGLISSELARLYEDESVGGPGRHLFDAVFVYGNKHRDGSFNSRLLEAGEAEGHTERSIVADLLVVADSSFDGDDEVTRRLFSSGCPAYTAAFSRVEKPVRDIASVVLKHIVAALDRERMEQASSALTDDEALRALGIEDGRLVAAERFEPSVKAALDAFGGFECYLPSAKHGASPAELPFAEAEAASCGCLSAFVRQNHIPRLEAALGDADTDDAALRADVEGRLTSALDAERFLTMGEQQWEQRLAREAGALLADDQALGRRGVPEAVRFILERRVAERVVVETRRAIEEAYVAAEATSRAFSELCCELASAATVRESGTHLNVEGFYAMVVDEALSDRRQLRQLYREVLRIGNSKADMIEVIYERGVLPLLEGGPGGRSPFSLGFMDEMVARLGQGRAEADASRVVGKELVENVGQRVAWSTLWPLYDDARALEVYLLAHDGGKAASELHEFLEKWPKPSTCGRVFLDAGTDEAATSLWFYPLELSHLR